MAIDETAGICFTAAMRERGSFLQEVPRGMIPLYQQISDQNGLLTLRSPVGATVKLAAFGDLAFHGPVLEALNGNSPAAVLDGVRPNTMAADLVIGNLESVLVRHPFSPLGRKACLVSDLRALAGLKAAGFNVLTLANNHIMDAGASGLADCLAGIKATGILTTGAGMDAAAARVPSAVKVGGLAFKVFAYSYGAEQIADRQQPGCNEAVWDRIQADLTEFCGPDDIPVVCLHMDAEFQGAPAPDRVGLCRKLAEGGVPIVLCHHPHVVQGLEVHAGSLIAYSLGNYIFPILPYMKSNSPECHMTFHLEIDVDRKGPVAARIEPALIDERGFPRRAYGAKRAEVLALIAERSAVLAEPEELERRYQRMAGQFTRSTFQNLYWALGERDFERFRMLLKSLVRSRTKRGWVRHYLQKRLFGI